MEKSKRITLTILILIGIITTIDLIFIYFKENFGIAGAAPSFCSINSYVDCDGVAKTSYALFLGIPLAIWGAFLYTVLLFLTYVDKINKKLNLEILKVFKNPKSYIATLGLISFCCSMILAGVQFFEIKKVCVLCFLTYFIDLSIALVAKEKGFFIKDIKNTVLDFISGAKKYLTLFIIVLAAGIGFLAYMQTSLVLSPSLQAEKENKEMHKSFEEFQKMRTNIYAIKGNTLGNPDGKVIVYIYSDFLCPFCKISNTMLHKLAKEEKEVVVYHINFPLDSECNPMLRDSVHPNSCMLSRYALAAEKQGAYWDMTSLLYDNLPNSEEEILTLAKSLDIDTNKLYKDANSNEIKEELSKQIERAINADIKGTPTIVMDGIEFRSALPYYKLKTYAKQAANRHKKD